MHPFRAAVEAQDLERGLIDELCVMVRPLSGVLALAEAMKAQLELAQRELGS